MAFKNFLSIALVSSAFLNIIAQGMPCNNFVCTNVAGSTSLCANAAGLIHNNTGAVVLIGVLAGLLVIPQSRHLVVRGLQACSRGIIGLSTHLHHWFASDRLVQVIDDYVDNLLESAVISGDVGVIEGLLRQGANPNVEGHEGWRPLHWAAYLGRIEAATRLIKADADVNSRNSRKWSPLHQAVVAGNLDVAKVLVQAGADLGAITDDGRGIEQLGFNQNFLGYRAHVNHCTENLFLGIEQSDITMVREAVQSGAVITGQDPQGQTPIHRSIDFYDPTKPTARDEIARLLVQTMGRQIRNVHNQAGLGPLHLAAIHGNLRLIRLLLLNGAEINAQDNAGNTPLHYASDYRAICLLLKNHADISVVNNDGEVPVATLVWLSGTLLQQMENR